MLTVVNKSEEGHVQLAADLLLGDLQVLKVLNLNNNLNKQTCKTK